MARRDDSRVSLAAANRGGQQLYFANTLTRNKVAAPARGGPHPRRSPRHQRDVRRLMDLFGLTAKGAQRYTATLHHPSLDSHPGRESTAADPG
jgi:hypothetical protein